MKIDELQSGLAESLAWMSALPIPEDSGMTTELGLSRVEIRKLLSLDGDLVLDKETLGIFENFLAARWDRIRSTSLSYFLQPHYLLSLLCHNLAKKIAKAHEELGMSPKQAYQYLMPTLRHDSFNVLMQDYDDFSLWEIVSSDDDSRLIPIRPTLANAAVNELKLLHTTQLGESEEVLTATEQERVIKHSEETDEYYKAMRELRRLETAGQGLGAALNLLCAGLAAGSITGTGSEYDAAGPTGSAVINFKRFLSYCTREERLQIFSLRHSNATYPSLGMLWDRINDIGRYHGFALRNIRNAASSSAATQKALMPAIDQIVHIAVEKGAELALIRRAVDAELASLAKSHRHYEAIKAALNSSAELRAGTSLAAGTGIRALAAVEQQAIDLIKELISAVREGSSAPATGASATLSAVYCVYLMGRDLKGVIDNPANASALTMIPIAFSAAPRAAVGAGAGAGAAAMVEVPVFESHELTVAVATRHLKKCILDQKLTDQALFARTHHDPVRSRALFTSSPYRVRYSYGAAGEERLGAQLRRFHFQQILTDESTATLRLMIETMTDLETWIGIVDPALMSPLFSKLENAYIYGLIVNSSALIAFLKKISPEKQGKFLELLGQEYLQSIIPTRAALEAFFSEDLARERKIQLCTLLGWDYIFSLINSIEDFASMLYCFREEGSNLLLSNAHPGFKLIFKNVDDLYLVIERIARHNPAYDSAERKALMRRIREGEAVMARASLGSLNAHRVDNLTLIRQFFAALGDDYLKVVLGASIATLDHSVEKKDLFRLCCGLDREERARLINLLDTEALRVHFTSLDSLIEFYRIANLRQHSALIAKFELAHLKALITNSSDLKKILAVMSIESQQLLISRLGREHLQTIINTVNDLVRVVDSLGEDNRSQLATVLTWNYVGRLSLNDGHSMGRLLRLFQLSAGNYFLMGCDTDSFEELFRAKSIAFFTDILTGIGRSSLSALSMARAFRADARPTVEMPSPSLTAIQLCTKLSVETLRRILNTPSTLRAADGNEVDLFLIFAMSNLDLRRFFINTVFDANLLQNSFRTIGSLLNFLKIIDSVEDRSSLVAKIDPAHLQSLLRSSEDFLKLWTFPLVQRNALMAKINDEYLIPFIVDALLNLRFDIHAGEFRRFDDATRARLLLLIERSFLSLNIGNVQEFCNVVHNLSDAQKARLISAMSVESLHAIINNYSDGAGRNAILALELLYKALMPNEQQVLIRKLTNPYLESLCTNWGNFSRVLTILADCRMSDFISLALLARTITRAEELISVLTKLSEARSIELIVAMDPRALMDILGRPALLQTVLAIMSTNQRNALWARLDDAFLKRLTLEDFYTNLCSHLDSAQTKSLLKKIELKFWLLGQRDPARADSVEPARARHLSGTPLIMTKIGGASLIRLLMQLNATDQLEMLEYLGGEFLTKLLLEKSDHSEFKLILDQIVLFKDYPMEKTLCRPALYALCLTYEHQRTAEAESPMLSTLFARGASKAEKLAACRWLKTVIAAGTPVDEAQATFLAVKPALSTSRLALLYQSHKTLLASTSVEASVVDDLCIRRKVA